MLGLPRIHARTHAIHPSVASRSLAWATRRLTSQSASLLARGALLSGTALHYFPGIPRAKRTGVLPARGFDIAEEGLNYVISNLRGRSKLGVSLGF